MSGQFACFQPCLKCSLFGAEDNKQCGVWPYMLSQKEIPLKKGEDIQVATRPQHFPQALGAAGASLTPIRRTKNRILNNNYSPQKHGRRGGMMQVAVSADGRVINASPLIPGR